MLLDERLVPGRRVRRVPDTRHSHRDKPVAQVKRLSERAAEIVSSRVTFVGCITHRVRIHGDNTCEQGSFQQRSSLFERPRDRRGLRVDLLHPRRRAMPGRQHSPVGVVEHEPLAGWVCIRCQEHDVRTARPAWHS